MESAVTPSDSISPVCCLDTSGAAERQAFAAIWVRPVEMG